MKISKKELSLIIVLGILFFSAGLIIDHYSPEFEFKTKISHHQAKDIAKNYLHERGYNYSDLIIGVQLWEDTDFITYLVRSVGEKKAQEYTTQMPLYDWQVNFAKEFSTESFAVYVNPITGNITAFSHVVPEKSTGVNITHENAQKIAEKELAKTGLPLTAYEFISDSSDDKIGRVDHSFTWEQKEPRLNYSGYSEPATIRYDFTLQGDEVLFDKYAHLPEDFPLDITRKMTIGNLLSNITVVLSLILFIASLVVFIIRFKKNRIHWKFALLFAAIVFVLVLAESFNDFESIKSGYVDSASTTSFPVYLSQNLIYGILFAFIIALTAFFAAAAGESLAEEAFKDGETHTLMLLKEKFNTKHFVTDTLIGYSLAFISLGYVAIFYFIAEKYFGVWELVQSDLSILLTALPLLSALAFSVMASVSEEFTFRLFSVTFFKRYFGFFAALIIPTVIWAFAHSNYPVFPVWTRGIELTINGLLLGFFFLRYGIIVMLIAHYVYNAFVFSYALLTLGSAFYFMNGIGAILFGALPIVIALVSYFIRKKRKAHYG